MKTSSARRASTATPPARGASLSESESPMASSMRREAGEPRRLAFTRSGSASTRGSQSGASRPAMHDTMCARSPPPPWLTGTSSPAMGSRASDVSAASGAFEAPPRRCAVPRTTSAASPAASGCGAMPETWITHRPERTRWKMAGASASGRNARASAEVDPAATLHGAPKSALSTAAPLSRDTRSTSDKASTLSGSARIACRLPRAARRGRSRPRRWRRAARRSPRSTRA